MEFRLEWQIYGLQARPQPRWAFLPARFSDELDEAEHPSSADAELAALFSPAAKLFSSSSITEVLAASGCDESAHRIAIDMRTRLIDAQIEDMYMGPLRCNAAWFQPP